MSRSNNPRVIAARVLAGVVRGQSLSGALAPALEKSDPAQRALIGELVYGTLREWPRLAGLSRQLLRKPLKAKDSDVFALVLIGFHQLSAMRVPQHAAVSETVEAARKLGKPWASSLVNGLLRSYLRERDQVEQSLTPAEAAALSDWLIEALQAQWPDHLTEIVAAARSHPPMTLRVNLARGSRADYLRMLEEHDIAALESKTVPSAVTLEKPLDVGRLPGFADGRVSVQDESAQLAAWLLSPKSGEALLDACAAPGGKACHLLELAPDAQLLATDISAERLARIHENTERLHLSPEIACLDASNAAQQLAGRQFDAVLADVPCSATGVIRRNPDVKLLRQAEDPGRFATQQDAILDGLWPLVKPGGRLLYVTCSILHEENDARIEQALARLPGVELGELGDHGGTRTAFGIQCLPNANGGDGLYFALLQRKTP